MTNKQAGTSRWLLATFILGSLLLCAFVSSATFYLGRQMAEPVEGETVAQVVEVEVTREVHIAVQEPVVNLEVEEGAEDRPASDESAPASTPAMVIEAEVEVLPAPTEMPETPVEEPAANQATADEQLAPDLALLHEVWQLLSQQYDGEVPDDAELLYAAIAGSVDQLGDDYTRFVPPDLAARFREDLQGSFEGIGAFVRENDEGFFEIVRPIDGQPAHLAGLQAGDLVVAVDGRSVIGVGLDETISLVRGPQGTEVTLTIRRADVEEFNVTITRARIEIPLVEAEMLPGDVAYVRLTSFSSNAEEQLSLAIGELLAEKPAGLVLDLRDNPGGYLNQALAVSDLFLDSGVILYERNNQGMDQTYLARPGGLVEDLNMVVLVNAGSASASEIVAGALQDHGRAVLVGETTFGKGSVQQPNVLSDGSELRVTIARWYTPNNASITGAGITPDIQIETPDSLGTEDDPQVQRAVDYILTGE